MLTGYIGGMSTTSWVGKSHQKTTDDTFGFWNIKLILSTNNNHIRLDTLDLICYREGFQCGPPKGADLGDQDPPPHLGDPTTSKRGKNIVHMCANDACFST